MRRKSDLKKKTIALLLTAVMITSLSGCASKPAAGPETDAAVASREAARSEADAGPESDSADFELNLFQILKFQKIKKIYHF